MRMSECEILRRDSIEDDIVDVRHVGVVLNREVRIRLPEADQTSFFFR